MNIKKLVVGTACVLACMVAAQTAHAQFMTHWEREMYRKSAEAFLYPSKGQQQGQQTQGNHTDSRIQSQQIQRNQHSSNQNQDQQTQGNQNTVNQNQGQQSQGTRTKIKKQGPQTEVKKNPSVSCAPTTYYVYAGREGKAMLAGEVLWERLKNFVGTAQDSQNK